MVARNVAQFLKPGVALPKESMRIAASPDDHGAASHVHIGRQPIYDGDRVFGYELLFRSHADARFASAKGASAAGTIIQNAFAEFGLESLVGNRRCFINVTREYLTGQLPLPFDPGQVVLEALENVRIDDEVVSFVVGLVRLASTSPSTTTWWAPTTSACSTSRRT